MKKLDKEIKEIIEHEIQALKNEIMIKSEKYLEHQSDTFDATSKELINSFEERLTWSDSIPGIANINTLTKSFIRHLTLSKSDQDRDDWNINNKPHSHDRLSSIIEYKIHHESRFQKFVTDSEVGDYDLYFIIIPKDSGTKSDNP